MFSKLLRLNSFPVSHKFLSLFLEFPTMLRPWKAIYRCLVATPLQDVAKDDERGSEGYEFRVWVLSLIKG